MAIESAIELKDFPIHNVLGLNLIDDKEIENFTEKNSGTLFKYYSTSKDGEWMRYLIFVKPSQWFYCRYKLIRPYTRSESEAYEKLQTDNIRDM